MQLPKKALLKEDCALTYVPILKSNLFVHVLVCFLRVTSLISIRQIFEADHFIYFIRLVAIDRTCVSAIFEYLIFQ